MTEEKATMSSDVAIQRILLENQIKQLEMSIEHDLALREIQVKSYDRERKLMRSTHVRPRSMRGNPFYINMDLFLHAHKNRPIKEDNERFISRMNRERVILSTLMSAARNQIALSAAQMIHFRDWAARFSNEDWILSANTICAQFGLLQPTLEQEIVQLRQFRLEEKIKADAIAELERKRRAELYAAKRKLQTETNVCKQCQDSDYRVSVCTQFVPSDDLINTCEKCEHSRNQHYENAEARAAGSRPLSNVSSACSIL